MTDQAFRFIHSSDFQLDQPLYGLSETPAHLRDLMIDAPYLAAERVFDAALQERVAGVLLSGNLLDLRSPSSRALAFLREQFARMAEAGIRVYWSGSDADSAERWPALLSLPDCVHHFATGAVEASGFTAGSVEVATILGRGGGRSGRVSADEFHTELLGAYSIALVCGDVEPQWISGGRIDYWALGGRSERKTVCTEPCMALYAGTPQGRHPLDVGPHGCTLVEVRRKDDVRFRFVPCDVARWQHERMIVSADMQWDAVTGRLAERVGELRSQATAHPLFVRWTLVGTDPATASTDLRRTARQVEQWLQRQFGMQSEPCWPVGVDIEAPEQVSAASYEEDTLLGDYLRAIRQLEEDSPMPALDLLSEEETRPVDFAWVADLSGTDNRDEVLRQASQLGSALLRGEDIG